jgi:N-acetylglutamate synthase
VGVFNVATAEAFRRRGFGAAATRAVLREGLERGASVAILQSSPAGHGVYEALGFREVVRYRVFVAR